jgi:hypothetical protein
MAVSGGADPMEIDTMMETHLEVITRTAKPIAALGTMAMRCRANGGVLGSC